MSTSSDTASIGDILQGLVTASDAAADGKISLDEMVSAFGNRAFGIIFLLFGLPNCFPMPPGLPILAGVVIIVVSVQMVAGADHLVLPRWLGQRRIASGLLRTMLDKSAKPLAYLEKFARPRLPLLSGRIMRRAIGVAGLALGIALMAPIPVFGGIPAGIAVTILGLAFAQEDGALIGFGVVVATPIALAVTSAMMFAIFQGAAAFF